MADAMSLDENDNIMMIGPTKAGKTTLLSVLRIAASRRMKNVGKVRVTPVNDAAKTLFREARDIVNSGGFNHAGTIQATRYEFQLGCTVEKRVWVEKIVEVPGTWPWSKPTKEDHGRHEMIPEDKLFNLTVIDGRGGDVFGKKNELEDKDEFEARRRELVDLATKSAALVVCINANDSINRRVFFEGLQDFLDDVHRSGKRVPFQRIAIAMTQADRLVERYGSSALVQLDDLDPADAAVEAIGRYTWSELFEALEPAARKNVYAGWVSVYGFIPDEGSVNFDSANNRVAIFNDDAKWIDDWVPHGVIEPFLFACTGASGGLKQLQEPTG